MKLNKVIREIKNKYFRKFDPEMVNYYRAKMPDKLDVIIHQDKESNAYWAEIEFNGKPSNDDIFTQSNNLNDFIELLFLNAKSSL